MLLYADLNRKYINYLRVFKECSDGYFSTLCDNQCHCNGAQEVCDKHTGMCESGCSHGWTGVDCQTSKQMLLLMFSLKQSPVCTTVPDIL